MSKHTGKYSIFTQLIYGLVFTGASQPNCRKAIFFSGQYKNEI